jgi:hypothetical protein
MSRDGRREARPGGRGHGGHGGDGATKGDPPSAPGNRALFAPNGVPPAGTIGCNGLDRRAGRTGREGPLPVLLKGGEFASVTELVDRIMAFIAEDNHTARPFRWTYDGRPLQAA